MSNIVERKTIKGNKWNWNRDADIEVFEDGTVRVQQAGQPVDVVLLTPRQVRAIALASEKAAG